MLNKNFSEKKCQTSENSNTDDIEEQVNNKINNSFMTFKSADTIKQNIVSKFIPFEGTGTSTGTGTGTTDNT